MKEIALRINSKMTKSDLLALKPRNAKFLHLLVDGEKYPEHVMLANQVDLLVGINGRIIFK